MDKLRVGLCQMLVQDDKEKNLIKAEELINSTIRKGANLVVLPEMFNCPYDNKFFPNYAESYPEGETINWLSRIAKEKKVFLVGGSIPERGLNGKIYNTSFIFDDNGNLIGKHRKIHLFDVDVAGGIRFKESDVLSYGDSLTIFDTPYGKIGVAICYDIRFPELLRLMALKGTRIIIIPAAFNMTTGPAHWESLFKVRALDNQVYMIGTAPARNLDSSYLSYGNSLIVDPWGTVINRINENEGIIVEDIDLNKIDKIREELPLIKHRRVDLYKLDLL